MTLSFSSFSIKDILTGRDTRGMAGDLTTEELCAPHTRAAQNLCTSYGGARGRDLSHQDADESHIHPERCSADLSLSVVNLRPHSYSEGITGEETVRREGEQQIWQ